MMSSCSGKHCGVAMLAWWLMVVGALNWGLVGLGWLFGGSDWNVVHMILKSLPMWVEAVVYLLVGLSAVLKLVGCRCKTCSSGEMAK